MRRLIAATLLAGLALLAAGCGSEPTGTAPQAASHRATADKSQALSTEFLDSLDYEEFQGSIEPGFGGMMLVTMHTWPGRCTFAINVPPDALPDDDPAAVAFSMRIPTYESYLAHEGMPLIVRLEPSHINFHAPIAVLATYMPWETVDPGDPFTYGYLDTEFHVYGDASLQWDAKARLWRVAFAVPHFSDWLTPGSDIPDGK